MVVKLLEDINTSEPEKIIYNVVEVRKKKESFPGLHFSIWGPKDLLTLYRHYRMSQIANFRIR